jgi:hypothetical protein
MTESLQDDICTESITQGCCEGGRRPSWQERMKSAEKGFLLPDVVQCCDVPVDHAAQVIQERGEVYGPFDVNMYGTALQISGMLAQHYGRTDLPVLPAYMAAMIATAFKSNRIVKSPTHEDSHLDLGVYLGKAKSLAK